MVSLISRLLPIFPLPQVVLMPGTVLPLQIFESHYKSLVKDVIASDYLFGITLYHQQPFSPEQGCYASVGTIAKIIDYDTLPNGQMNIVAEGIERFKIIQPENYIKPYLQGFIQIYSDYPDSKLNPELVPQLKEAYQNIVRLNQLLSGKELEAEPYSSVVIPDEPSALSFHIADRIQNDVGFKQTLLESQSVEFRLTRELAYVRGALKRLTLYNQIEDVFRQVKS